MTPSAAAATRSVPVDKAGVGAAVLNAFRQVGGSIGIALMGAIVAHEAGGVRSVDAFMAGFERALQVAAVIAVVGAVVAFVLVRPHEQEERARAMPEPPFEPRRQNSTGCLTRARRSPSDDRLRWSKRVAPRAKPGSAGREPTRPLLGGRCKEGVVGEPWVPPRK